MDKIEAHEELCLERLQGIHAAITELKGELKGQRRAAWGVVLAICGWLAIQVYDGLKDRPAIAPAAQAATLER